MSNEDIKIVDIPSEKFEFVNSGDKIHDTKFETKPIGYFKDALIRFCKNKASVAAFIIIIFIVLFALIVPITTPKSKATVMDTYYKKNGPRNVVLKESLGIMGGAKNLEQNERALILEIAKGVGAEFNENTDTITIGEAMNSYYQPVTKYSYGGENSLGVNSKAFYNVKIDTYLSVGFEYIAIEQSKYREIIEWEKETGLKVIYPLVAENEYCIDSTEANYWYKTTSKGVPVSTTKGKDTRLEFSEDLVLEDNYLRDNDGNLVYYRYSGGGDANTAMYQVRVLYYNYYRYMYGFEPNYFLGTDSQGYDLAYRMATGIRLSLILAVVVSAINLVLGAIIGAVEGYYGGLTDLIIERIKDVLSGVPFIILATLFQLHLAKQVGPLLSLIFAFVVTGWLGTSARVRTQFYRFKNQEYVMAARTLGAKDSRIMWKHIFPNTLGTLITSSVLVIPGVISSESMLSYLGIATLGDAKTTSLGTLLSEASKLWTDHPHLMIAPAVVLSLLMICFNLFGNGLRDAFNPTLRGSEE
ncbi:MAG: ABC transporter permease [Bacilli bacterium]|nr:ABC transporter permease [Bacilli bacterium]